MDTPDTAELGSSGLRVPRIGIGSAALGGLYYSVDEDEAVRTVRRAVELGASYVDTAPLYGHGRSERIVGQALSPLARGDYVLSTKVGRVLEPVSAPSASDYFVDLPPFEPVFDYSRSGVLRSLEESLERMGLDSVDVLYVHDPDEGRSVFHAFSGPDHYRQVIDEVMPTLSELRSQGVIRAVGVGMNGWQMLAQFARDGDFDCFLLAGRYTLLDQSALPEFLPLCESKNISVVIGGPYNSGILASDLSLGATYFYDQAPPAVLERARSIKAICDRYGVPLKAAALQFCLAHPAVASVIPGARSVEEAEENCEMVLVPIPADMWAELRQARLIPADAPALTG
ncbi:MAG: aldo/keto reductase [Chloroflexi bacterium]|nr:aldo/keto reductase [Chloroflexota bacterium]